MPQKRRSGIWSAWLAGYPRAAWSSSGTPRGPASAEPLASSVLRSHPVLLHSVLGESYTAERSKERNFRWRNTHHRRDQLTRYDRPMHKSEAAKEPTATALFPTLGSGRWVDLSR